MPIDAKALNALIDIELKHLSDTRVLEHIRSLLVEPNIVLLDWDYGQPGDRYPCWMVLEHDQSGSGIAYCESGFGPQNPWGLVRLRSDENEYGSMGMDSAWYSIFLEAYFESFASAYLPIWRVFKTDSSGIPEPITDEGSWDTTWEHVMELREADAASCYDCDHSISYRR